MPGTLDMPGLTITGTPGIAAMDPSVVGPSGFTGTLPQPVPRPIPINPVTQAGSWLQNQYRTAPPATSIPVPSNPISSLYTAFARPKTSEGIPYKDQSGMVDREERDEKEEATKKEERNPAAFTPDELTDASISPTPGEAPTVVHVAAENLPLTAPEYSKALEESTGERVASIRKEEEATDELAGAQKEGLFQQGDVGTGLASKVEKEQGANEDRTLALLQLYKERSEQAAQGKIDPNGFQKDLGILGNIRMGLAQAMGAFGATLSHGQNYAQENLHRMIENHIAAQRYNLENQHRGVEDVGAMYKMAYELTGDHREAAKLTGQFYLNAAKNYADARLPEPQAKVFNAKADQEIARIKGEGTKEQIATHKYVAAHDVVQPSAGDAGPDLSQVDYKAQKEISDKMQEAKLPQAEEALKQADSVLAGNAVGIGGLNRLPIVGAVHAALSNEASANQNKLHGLALALAPTINGRSGNSYTTEELEKILYGNGSVESRKAGLEWSRREVALKRAEVFAAHDRTQVAIYLYNLKRQQAIAGALASGASLPYQPAGGAPTQTQAQAGSIPPALEQKPEIKDKVPKGAGRGGGSKASQKSGSGVTFPKEGRPIIK